jgi:hypothetical protein
MSQMASEWRERALHVVGRASLERHADEDAIPLEDVLEEELEFLHPSPQGPAGPTTTHGDDQWEFDPSQILALDRLAARLYAPDVGEDIVGAERSIAVALRAANELLRRTNAEISAAGTDAEPVSEAAVSADLNRLLREDIPEFRNLPLPGGLRAAVEHYDGAPTTEGRVRLNRRLLEFLFPTEVSRIRDIRLASLYRRLGDTKHSALCLSGGGIRSATFSLGVIQGLAERGVLDRFDYLSTVSGGGYLGAWLTAWMAQVGRTQATRDLNAAPRSKVDGEPAPVRHLRTYSNFLSPKVGFLSADTWTLVATYLRNLLLTWLILIPLLAAATLAPYLALAVVRSQPRHWGVPPSSFLPGVLAILALISGAVGIHFVHKNRPERDAESAERRDAFQNRGQGTFLLRCLLPLAVSATLLTTAWIWTEDWGTTFKPGFWTFGAFGAAMHLLGYSFTGRKGHSPRESALIAITGAAAGWLGYLATLGLAAASDTLTGSRWRDVAYVTFATPMFLAIVVLSGSIFIGINSSRSSDAEREWSARFNAWLLIAIVAWTAASALILMALPFVAERTAALAGTGTLGALSGVIAARLGFSGTTGAQTSDAPSSSKGAMAAVKAALRAKGLIILTVISLAGLALLLSAFDGWLLGAVCRWMESTCALPAGDAAGRLHTRDGLDPLPAAVMVVALILGVVGAAMGRTIDSNKFSLHAMYRARLIRAYLGAARPAGERTPDPFTGFDEKDNRFMHEMQLAAGPTDEDRPLIHVVNIALNLVGGSNLAWQERRADSFTVTSLHAGSHRLGYRRTSPAPGKPRFDRKEREAESSPRPRIYGGTNGVSLGTAITISGAAASPNMGYHSSSLVTFLMTLFNVRLGWWLGNPGPAGDTTFDRASPRVGLRPILAEMFGRTNDGNAYVYLSDGGHFENLGLYEMVLRRCHRIVVIDASCDEKGSLGDLGNAIRKIRIDLGVPIEFRSGFPEQNRDTPGDKGPLTDYCAIADIEYSCVDRPDGEGASASPPHVGKLIYIKPALRGEESKDIYTYSRGSAAFPHESTVDQFFSESQFESYRALGHHIVNRIFADDRLRKELEG